MQSALPTPKILYTALLLQLFKAYVWLAENETASEAYVLAELYLFHTKWGPRLFYHSSKEVLCTCIRLLFVVFMWEDSPGAPPSATAHELFRGFSYIAPIILSDIPAPKQLVRNSHIISSVSVQLLLWYIKKHIFYHFPIIYSNIFSAMRLLARLCICFHFILSVCDEHDSSRNGLSVGHCMIKVVIWYLLTLCIGLCLFLSFNIVCIVFFWHD